MSHISAIRLIVMINEYKYVVVPFLNSGKSICAMTSCKCSWLCNYSSIILYMNIMRVGNHVIVILMVDFD